MTTNKTATGIVKKVRRPQADPWEDLKHRLFAGVVGTIVVILFSLAVGG